MRKLTVHLNIWFDDMAAETTDDARDAVKQALVAMHAECQSQIAEALHEIGAKDVHMSTVVF